MATKFTIKGAQERMEQLKNEIDYLQVLTDGTIRERREVMIEDAPESVQSILLGELLKRQTELEMLEENVSHALEQLELISLDK